MWNTDFEMDLITIEDIRSVMNTHNTVCVLPQNNIFLYLILQSKSLRTFHIYFIFYH